MTKIVMNAIISVPCIYLKNILRNGMNLTKLLFSLHIIHTLIVCLVLVIIFKNTKHQYHKGKYPKRNTVLEIMVLKLFAIYQSYIYCILKVYDLTSIKSYLTET